jgi:hypothetical protein
MTEIQAKQTDNILKICFSNKFRNSKYAAVAYCKRRDEWQKS